MCSLTEDEVALLVNDVEVANFQRTDVEFSETATDVFTVVGADEPLFFHPQDKATFLIDWRGAKSAADRIALAAPQIPPTPTEASLATVYQRPSRSRVVAVVLALLLGGLGVHKFYLGQTGLGVLYFVFSWTLIPAIIGFIEGLIFAFMSDQEFAQKYD